MTERMSDEVFEEVVRELHAGKISARKLLEDEIRRARESEAQLREDYRRAVSNLSSAVVERDMWQEKLRAKIAQLDETMDQRDAAIVALDAARMEIAGMRQSALHKQSGALLREMKQVKDKLDRAFAVAERATNELESALAERAQMLRTIELAKACRDEGEKGLTAALKQVRVLEAERDQLARVLGDHPGISHMQQERDDAMKQVKLIQYETFTEAMRRCEYVMNLPNLYNETARHIAKEIRNGIEAMRENGGPLTTRLD